MTTADRPAPPPELAPNVTIDVVRLVAAIAIVVTVWLSITDVLQLAFPGGSQGNVRIGILASLITIPLHVRHLIYGVRGERPPGGAWTLAILAVVTLVTPYFAGFAWIREFTPLAVSILIIIPGRRGFVLAGLLAVLPLVMVGTQWYTGPPPFPGFYLAFVIVWRSVTQFVPLRILAALRALGSATRELEARAVVQARVRIDTELRRSIGPSLHQIIAHGDAARLAASADPSRAIAELRALVAESRRALADARRVVAGYRASSLRAELDAAAALLEASGATVQVIAEDGVSLDVPDPRAREIIRVAIADALRDEPRASYRLHVRRQASGILDVTVSFGHQAPGTP